MKKGLDKLKIIIAIFVTILLAGTGCIALAQLPDSRPLTIEKPIDRELKGDEFHSYSLSLQAGQFLNVVVEQNGIDVVVALFDPKNQKIVEVDSPNGTQGSEPISIIIATTGTYRLEVRSLEKTAAPGHYEAKIKELRTATEKDKTTLAAQLLFAEGEQLRLKGTSQSLRDAVKKYEATLPFYHLNGDKLSEAIALNNIGVSYRDLGERQKALDYYALALPIAAALGSKANEATTLNNIGLVYGELGENQKALEYYARALVDLRAVKDVDGEANTLNGIGTICWNLGELQKAIEYLTQALPLRRAAGNQGGEADTLNNIGLIYYDLGVNQKALDYYDQALSLYRAIGDQAGEATTLTNAGLIYHDLGQRQKALEYYNLALPLRRAVGNKSREADTLNSIGGVYRDMGEKQKALEFFSQALPIYRSGGNKDREAIALNNIGLIYSDLGQRQKALDYFVQSMPLRRLSGTRRGEATTLNSLAYDWNLAGNARFAAFYGKLSVNNYQVLRSNVQGLDKNLQKTFLKSIEKPYRSLANALIVQKRYGEAQQILNLFKDQQFFDFRSDKPLDLLVMTPREASLTANFNQKIESVVAIIRESDDLIHNIGERQPTIDEAAKLKVLNGKLISANEDYRAFLKKAEMEFAAPLDERDKVSEVADLGTMQAALRETSRSTGQKTVAVYTLVGDDGFRTLLVTADSITSAAYAIKGKDLNTKALEFWKLLRTPKYDPKYAAKELYDIVFEPLIDKLPKDTKTILWSLDGNLRYVPMATLFDGKQYLIERYQNVVFTRANKEQMMREVDNGRIGTGMGSSEAHKVVLGANSFNASALPSVKTELGRIFRQDSRGVLKGDVLLDERFTKVAMLDALKTRKPLVHIASHFRFVAGDEANSFLLLGDGTPFTLDEMKNQKDLFGGVELLVLSACQTAAQRPDANGREVDGFAELAQRLGAGAVMASLWEVSDNSTAELMTRFYQDYTKTGENKAAAIRKAQLALLKGEYGTFSTENRQLTQDAAEAEIGIKIIPGKLHLYKSNPNQPFAHPFFWSPFILIGNWK